MDPVYPLSHNVVFASCAFGQALYLGKKNVFGIISNVMNGLGPVSSSSPKIITKCDILNILCTWLGARKHPQVDILQHPQVDNIRPMNVLPWIGVVEPVVRSTLSFG